jgi:hypothetical protein
MFADDGRCPSARTRDFGQVNPRDRNDRIGGQAFGLGKRRIRLALRSGAQGEVDEAGVVFTTPMETKPAWP